MYVYTWVDKLMCVLKNVWKRTECEEIKEIWNQEFSHILGTRICKKFGKMCGNICTPGCFLDEYGITVQGLLDWYGVDLGFTRPLFIWTDLCVVYVFIISTHLNV